MPFMHKLDEFRTIRLLHEQAEREAHAMGDDLPGAEHLLLAALGLPDGTAGAAFRRAGADPDGFRAAIQASHDQALDGVGVRPVGSPAASAPALVSAPGPRSRRVFHSTASAQTAFRRAVELSAVPKPRRLLGAHVVAAVAEAEHGTAARAIRALGLEPGALREAATAELQATGAR